ncbi:hypothetical protein OAB63_04620, partial [Alphaproteobacteria bacterium]|nr:hypothetical protein [Alphaproteobacteria bacterium]
ASNFQANYIKTIIKSSIKDDFYNQNIKEIHQSSETELLSKITNFTYKDILDLNLSDNDSVYEIKGNYGIISLSLH